METLYLLEEKSWCLYSLTNGPLKTDPLDQTMWKPLFSSLQMIHWMEQSTVCVYPWLFAPVCGKRNDSSKNQRIQHKGACSTTSRLQSKDSLSLLFLSGLNLDERTGGSTSIFFFKYSSELWRLAVTCCERQRDVQLPHDHRLLPRTVKQNDKSWFPVPLVYTFWP